MNVDSELLRDLRAVAVELYEVIEERGYRVDVAMDVDPSFGSAMSRSWVHRDLVIDAVETAASRVGVDFRSVNGTGAELRALASGADHRFRLRKARKGANGDFVVAANSDSALGSEDSSFFREVPWVFSWTVSSDGSIDEVFVARVRGKTAGSPGELILGDPILLERSRLPETGFSPAEESLDVFEKEDDRRETETGEIAT